VEVDSIMDSVNEYIDSYEDEKKEWVVAFVTFMRKNYPNWEETISYQMPTYKFLGQYIAFNATKTHFTFHTLDFVMLEELKEELTNAKFGKRCVKVKYKDKDSIPILFDACRKIADRSKMEDTNDFVI
jgi:uncharacterized protein YdhG (YjbR/CyaY superfamily)